jgi:hypothetical protein
MTRCASRGAPPCVDYGSDDFPRAVGQVDAVADLAGGDLLNRVVSQIRQWGIGSQPHVPRRPGAQRREPDPSAGPVAVGRDVTTGHQPRAATGSGGLGPQVSRARSPGGKVLLRVREVPTQRHRTSAAVVARRQLVGSSRSVLASKPRWPQAILSHGPPGWTRRPRAGTGPVRSPEPPTVPAPAARRRSCQGAA